MTRKIIKFHILFHYFSFNITINNYSKILKILTQCEITIFSLLTQFLKQFFYEAYEHQSLSNVSSFLKLKSPKFLSFAYKFILERNKFQTTVDVPKFGNFHHSSISKACYELQKQCTSRQKNLYQRLEHEQSDETYLRIF